LDEGEQLAKEKKHPNEGEREKKIQALRWTGKKCYVGRAFIEGKKFLLLKRGKGSASDYLGGEWAGWPSAFPPLERAGSSRSHHEKRYFNLGREGMLINSPAPKEKDRIAKI